MTRLLSLALIVFALLHVACEKDSSMTTEQVGFTLFGELAPATISAYGQIIDDAGNPVANARVAAGDASTTTDVQGLWRLDNAKVKATFGYITFESADHLHGSRTVYAREGSLYEVNVELLRRDQSFSVDAASGGTVTLPGAGASVSFGPAAFAKTDGTPIASGSVKVIAHYLDPNDPRTYDRMPGDLRGVPNAGAGDFRQNMTLLTSYGMMAVELQTDGGAGAKLAEGQRATLTMPLTGQAAATAPQSIPLWYFDEAAGVWIEEGAATRQGDAYVGMVSHFTFWNCDVPNDFIELCGSVGFHPAGLQAVILTTPLQVRITSSTRFGTRTTLVDGEGNFCGAVPKGEALVLEVIGDCGEVVFTQTVGPFEERVLLEPVVVPKSSARFLKVSGQVVCNGEPNANASVNIRQGRGRGYSQAVDQNGFFEFELIACGAEQIILTAYDYNSLSRSTDLVFESTQDVFAGLIEACENGLDEFLSFTINERGEPDLFSEEPVFKIDSGLHSLRSLEQAIVDGPGMIVSFGNGFFDQPSGTYTLEPGTYLEYSRFFIRDNYILSGVQVTFTKRPGSEQISGYIDSTEVTGTDVSGDQFRRKISLRFAFYRD